MLFERIDVGVSPAELLSSFGYGPDRPPAPAVARAAAEACRTAMAAAWCRGAAETGRIEAAAGGVSLMGAFLAPPPHVARHLCGFRTAAADRKSVV